VKSKGIIFWLQMIPIILIAFEGLVIGVAYCIGPEKGKLILFYLSGFILFEMAIFLIANNLSISNSQDFTNTNFIHLDKTIKTINNASIEILETRDEFYEKLKKSRSNAIKKLLLTQLDPWPPISYEGGGPRQEYFNADIKFAESHPNVTICRMLSIERQEKLNWVKDFIKETKGFSNVFFAYINISNIEKSAPFPKILSLQIIDSEEIFHLNPEYSYMPRQYQECFYIKNKKLANIYEKYYYAVWREIGNDKSDDFKIGCILKNGNDDEGYEIKLDKIREKFTITST